MKNHRAIINLWDSQALPGSCYIRSPLGSRTYFPSNIRLSMMEPRNEGNDLPFSEIIERDQRLSKSKLGCSSCIKSPSHLYQPLVTGARACSWPFRPCECESHSIWPGLRSLTTCRPLVVVNVGSTVSRFAVADALRRLGLLDICLQIKLSDPIVLRRF